MRIMVVLFGALVACSNTYHPEYHPVTVTQYSQDVSYPVSVHNAASSPEQRSPIVVSAGPGSVVTQPGAPTLPAMPPPPQPPTPPPGWPN